MTEHKPGDTHPESALEHMEQEFHELEGDTSRARWIPWGIGVVVILAVVVAYLLFPAEEEAPVVAGGVVIETLEPRAGRLDGAPGAFRWESITGRFDYVFKLFVEGAPAPLVEHQVKEPMLRLTSEELAQVQAGKSYVWTVTARRRDGSAIGTGKAKFQVP
jgi:hypothetical protein